MGNFESGALILRSEKVDQLLEPYREAISRALSELQEPGQRLSKLAYDYVEKGGKRIRPAVTLLTCEALSGSYKEAMPIALAYELAHAASLTQDDIIDDSATRHNRPTAHTKHGVTTAILVSDLLIFKIFDELAEYSDVEISKDRLAELTWYVGKAAKEAAEGEFLEMELSKRAEPSVEEYIRLAKMKTGALFGAAAASGAIVAGAKPKQVTDMHEFGINLGVAFQMTDDILDLTGSAVEMGKPMLKDIQNNASNIVITHALAEADPRTGNSIRYIMKRSAFGFVEAEEILGLLDDLGSVQYATQLCRKQAAAARARLRSLAKGGPRKTLEELTYWLEDRRK